MNILFMTIGKMDNIEDHTIYCDLLRCFRDAGHKVYTISPYEKVTGLKTKYEKKNGVNMLHVRTGNVTGKAGLIEKGIAQLSIELVFIKAIKRYYSNVKFNLVMYSTPPITFCNVIEYVKKRDGAQSYLLLKDIFPQNAVDIGMMQKNGIKGILYRFFREKEKKLYKISDHIGCMSKANIDYVIRHNPEINRDKVILCPNCIEPIDMSISTEVRKHIREKYSIPQDKTVFVYGGNLGRPQGIPFIIKCLMKQKENNKVFFLIIGDGTEFEKLKEFFDKEKPKNMKLMSKLPKDEYDAMVAACDVGLIFLDHRFTIPNFPSRLLSYMQAKIPVLAATDTNTDVGKVITDGGFGWWCESNNVNAFSKLVEAASSADLTQMKINEIKYLMENYTVSMVYENIKVKVGSEY